MDSLGNIKIGDFGLATTDIGYELYGDIDVSGNVTSGEVRAVRTLQAAAEGSATLADPHTRGVGTALYRAPEQGGAMGLGGRSYDSKADIFSLGIVLFEMCHRPFNTAMERIETIRELRDHKKLPQEFVTVTPLAFQRLILWMVDICPLNRPTSGELMSSSLLDEIGTINRPRSISSCRGSSLSETTTTSAPVPERMIDLKSLPVLKINISYAALRCWGTLIGLYCSDPVNRDTHRRTLCEMCAQDTNICSEIKSSIDELHQHAAVHGFNSSDDDVRYVLLRSGIDNMMDLMAYKLSALQSMKSSGLFVKDSEITNEDVPA